jgi:hypothetical protein
MKTLLKFAGMGLIGSFVLVGFTSNASVQFSAAVQINARADFDAPLGTLGTWVTVGTYGRCWHPSGVAATWRPYCAGSWAWTDCGWYWESDEPWAWACYHYGRWVFDSEWGWVWIPDVEWAPAWVYWRTGGGYIGWAPCPPSGVVVAPSLFAFVEVGHFHDPIRPTAVIVNNTTIINQTTVINNVRHETRTIDGSSRRVAISDGPGIDVVQKATGKQIAAISVQEAIHRTSMPSNLRRETPAPQQDKSKVVPEQPGKTGLPESPANGRSPGKYEERPAPAPKPGNPGLPPSREKNSPPETQKRKGEEAKPNHGPGKPETPPGKPNEPKDAPGHESPPKDKGQEP